MVEPVAEIAVAALAPGPRAVHGRDELDEAPVGEVDAGGHAGDGAAQLGGIVGDEVQIVGLQFAHCLLGGGFGGAVEIVRGLFVRHGHDSRTSVWAL